MFLLSRHWLLPSVVLVLSDQLRCSPLNPNRAAPGVFPPYRQKPSSAYSQIALPLTVFFSSENANKNEPPAVTGSEQFLSGRSSNVLDSQDQVRFEQLVLPHLDAAYNLARWLLRSPADAEDPTQEAMLGSYKFFSSSRGGDARAWLLQIVCKSATPRLGRTPGRRT